MGAAARRCGRHGGGWCRQSTLHSTQHKLKHNTDTTQVMKSARYIRNSCKTLHKIVPCFALVTFPGNRKWLTHSHHFTKFVTLNCLIFSLKMWPLPQTKIYSNTA